MGERGGWLAGAACPEFPVVRARGHVAAHRIWGKRKLPLTGRPKWRGAVWVIMGWVGLVGPAH
jgi:hypothetical protein